MTISNLIKDLLTPTVPQIVLTPFQKRLIKSRKAVKSIKAKEKAKRTTAEKMADWMTSTFGSIWFLALNIIWFGAWIFINLGYYPKIEIFDPFPFGLLTMVVSLEAIILAIFVLISQNREQRVNDLRDEIDLEVDIITENELTKLLEIVVQIAKKNKIDLSKDEVLQEMLKPLDKEKIEKGLQQEV